MPLPTSETDNSSIGQKQELSALIEYLSALSFLGHLRHSLLSDLS